MRVMRSLADLRGSILVVLTAVAAAAAWGQTAEGPKETQGLLARGSAAEYTARGQAGKVTIAAEFTGHGIPTEQQPLVSEEYVGVEVALFGPPDGHLTITATDFSLKINGKKTALESQPWGLVAKEIKDPEWMPPEPVEEKSKGGLSGSGGGARQPGDPPPLPPKVPVELLRSWQQLLKKCALAEGDRALPQAGMLFFHLRGKLEKIKSVELVYGGPAGKAAVRLQ